MAYSLIDDVIGAQALTVTDTVQRHPLGKIVRGKDPIYGEGEFIYLLGVANTIVGSVVTWHPSTFQTTLCAVGGNVPQGVAVALSANVAGQWGWYQVGGVAIGAKSATICLVAGVAVGVLTTGLFAGTASNKEISGAVCAVTASAKTGVVTVPIMLTRPTKQGRVT